MKPEAIIHVRFLEPNEGGRKNEIQGSNFGCPLMVGEKAFDCRFILDQGSRIQPGETYEIPVQFRDPESALKYVTVGETITLWEGKIIAEGSVIQII